MGLANAVNKLKDSPAKSKVVILLTDGENNAGQIQPMMAAEIAKPVERERLHHRRRQRGLVQMPRADEGGGWIVHQQPRESTANLQRIAHVTGGRSSWRRTTTAREIYREIDALERTTMEVSETNFFDELATC
jgi:Ca-activated chloride channel homolog